MGGTPTEWPSSLDTARTPRLLSISVPSEAPRWVRPSRTKAGPDGVGPSDRTYISQTRPDTTCLGLVILNHIYTLGWLRRGINVGIYTSPMECLGMCIYKETAQTSLGTLTSRPKTYLRSTSCLGALSGDLQVV